MYNDCGLPLPNDLLNDCDDFDFCLNPSGGEGRETDPSPTSVATREFAFDSRDNRRPPPARSSKKGSCVDECTDEWWSAASESLTWGNTPDGGDDRPLQNMSDFMIGSMKKHSTMMRYHFEDDAQKSSRPRQVQTKIPDPERLGPENFWSQVDDDYSELTWPTPGTTPANNARNNTTNATPRKQNESIPSQKGSSTGSCDGFEVVHTRNKKDGNKASSDSFQDDVDVFDDSFPVDWGKDYYFSPSEEKEKGKSKSDSFSKGWGGADFPSDLDWSPKQDEDGNIEYSPQEDFGI